MYTSGKTYKKIFFLRSFPLMDILWTFYVYFMDIKFRMLGICIVIFLFSKFNGV